MKTRSRHHPEAIAAAYTSLSPEEQLSVDELAEQLMGPHSGIRNVGKKTAIEILAAVGMLIVEQGAGARRGP